MEGRNLRKFSLVALVALSVLLLISWIWYREKVFFADASYVLFDIVNYKMFDIQFSRYGSFISQLVPYLGFKLHLPISFIITAYGIGFHVFYLGVACILVFRYRQYSLAVLMALFYCLFVSDSFFWVSEIPQGAGWMFLLIGMTLHAGTAKWKIYRVAVPFLILAFLTLFTHFVLIIPTLFLWVYLVADTARWPWSRKDTAILSALLTAIIVLKFVIALSGSGSGDGPHLYGVTHVSFRDIYHSFSTPVVTMFLQRCRTIYWVSFLVFLPGIYSLVRKRKMMLAGWVILSAIGYIVIMGLTYGNEDEHVQLFHIESEWMCIGILLAAPFAFGFLPGLKPTAGLILLSAIFLVRIVYIGDTLPQFRWRIHFQERVLAKMKQKGITKLALYRDTALTPRYMIDWAAGYESALRSASAGDNPQRTFVFIDRVNNQEVTTKLADPKCVYLWDAISLARLNHDYFNFDTLHAYKVMTYEQLMH